MIKEKVNRVEEILREYPESRDNDNELLAEYWRQELMVIKHENMGIPRKVVNINDSGDAALTHREIDLVHFIVRSGILSQPDSITRARRKLQEEVPSLRGEKYHKRHSAIPKVKQEIKEIPEMRGSKEAINQISYELFGR
tara:strand:+ start:135 stop:554 length:420 start_codon:yes stop_codon:yes gene_type:complete